MIVSISIHHPKPGAEAALIDSMHRYGNAIKGAPGLVGVYTLQDKAAGVLVGMAIWESQEAKDASIHLARAAVANDPFDEWEARTSAAFRWSRYKRIKLGVINGLKLCATAIVGFPLLFH